ncbi:hypothetical protein GW17_00034584 [Ensete ventricosum]|nr:hypothetical protein GW17_00034584 [Ensete ventricosum]
MAAISFARIQEEQLNHEVRRTMVAPRPAMPRPTAHSTAIQAPAPKKLTRDELRERSAKELCWHCDEPWSREHHRKKGRLLVIEPVEDEDNETSEEALEPKEEAMEEESQPANYRVHALAGYSNPQMMKVRGLLKQQLITVLIGTGSTNNFLNNKVVACLVLQIEAVGLVVGGSPLRASYNRPPLPASHCKRVCPRATVAPVGWPQPTVPTGAAPASCCPRERRRPPLRATAAMSSASLPCGLLPLQAASGSLVGWPWPHPDRGWPALYGAGRRWSPLLLAAFAVKMQQECVE